MASTRGPLPKRDATSIRRRDHAANRADVVEVSTVTKAPPLDDGFDYHPRAREAYESLERSGQSVYFEPSDWALASLRARLATRLELALDSGGGTGVAALVAEISKIDTRLGVTENDRRRMRVEVARPDEAAADVAPAVAARFAKLAGNG